MKKIIIGITGGIGTGKSTITSYLIGRKYSVIDADEIARASLAYGEISYNKVIGIFGKEIMLPNKEINRKKLADIVFNDEQSLIKLEDVTTAVVVKKIKDIAIAFKKDDCMYSGFEKSNLLFIDAPLLIEKNLNLLCDYVWVVTAPLEKIIDRIKVRDNISLSEIQARINNQMPESEKINYATHIIVNNLDILNLYSKIDKTISEITSSFQYNSKT